jgi:hypothetical protein
MLLKKINRASKVEVALHWCVLVMRRTYVEGRGDVLRCDDMVISNFISQVMGKFLRSFLKVVITDDSDGREEHQSVLFFTACPSLIGSIRHWHWQEKK